MTTPKNRLPFTLVLCAFLLFSSCNFTEKQNTILCEERAFHSYNNVVSQMFSSHHVYTGQYGTPSNLEAFAAVETCAYLAEPYLENGIAAHWYPQYTATVVIALDRSQTDAKIEGWRDLLYTEDSVGVIENDMTFILAAMSYGLEGENYTSYQAARMLEALNLQKRLQFDELSSPIIICFDYQAAAMISNGRQIEIIIPAEGTFSFVKGLLSTQPLTLPENTDALLLSAGFRLPNGQSDLSMYPAPEAYEVAVYPSDTVRLNRLFESTTRTVRRSILHTHLFNTADGREHHLMVLCFTVLVMLWTGYVLHRTLQKKVRLAVLLSSILMVGWVLLRTFKWQLGFGVLSRYCWYGYYFFQLGLALVLLWVSWSVDKTDDTLPSPLWWRICCCLNLALFALVITNDFHLLTFVMDLTRADAESSYTYGPFYYIVLVAVMAEIVLSFAMLLQKGRKSPNRNGILFPFSFYSLLFVYCIAYIMRIPIAVQSDLAIVVCIFSLLFMESCIRVGLIPVNTKYKKLFAASTLRMQIADHAGNTVFSSTKSIPPEPKLWARLSKEQSTSLLVNKNTILFASPVNGGTVIWQEDISRINKLHRELKLSIKKLEAANALLDGQGQVSGRLALVEARSTLFSELEAEIETKTLLLSHLITALPTYDDKRFQMARVTLLLCYIKRRCNLFFRERESDCLPSDELVLYLNEIAEFSELINIQVLITAKNIPDMLTRQATLFYDFLYTILEWCVYENCHTLLVQLLFEKDSFTLSLLPSARADAFNPDHTLLSSIEKEGGELIYKDLDDTLGITLFFPKKEGSL